MYSVDKLLKRAALMVLTGVFVTGVYAKKGEVNTIKIKNASANAIYVAVYYKVKGAAGLGAKYKRGTEPTEIAAGQDMDVDLPKFKLMKSRFVFVSEDANDLSGDLKVKDAIKKFTGRIYDLGVKVPELLELIYKGGVLIKVGL